jgi:hypothetical protein
MPLMCPYVLAPTHRYFKRFRLWVLKHTKVLLFGAFGKWYCPLLPL